MVSEAEIDIDHLGKWVGSQAVTSDTIDTALIERFVATFDLDPARYADQAPAGIHWCLSPYFAATAQLGADGHPERGGFLPPVPLPRRMWAGGSLEFFRRFQPGQTVNRQSRVDDVRLKQGRSGPLIFVSVSHNYSAGNSTILKERQDIVYRGLEAGGTEAGRPATPATQIGDFSRSHVASPPLLFRYSALTFNSHRIHYDRTYCVEEEKYPGLVVHGPLQATYLLQLAVEEKGWPSTFDFRGRSPLFDGGFSAHGAITEGEGRFWTNDAHGAVTMTAEAAWR